MITDLILHEKAREILHRVKPFITGIPDLGILQKAFDRLPKASSWKEEFYTIMVELQEEHHQEVIDLDAPPMMPQTYSRVASYKITFTKMIDNGKPTWVYIGPVKY